MPANFFFYRRSSPIALKDQLKEWFVFDVFDMLNVNADLLEGLSKVLELLFNGFSLVLTFVKDLPPLLFLFFRRLFAQKFQS